ncbi:hypothetical protein ALC60_10096 [Trachymyrmex zeteki]|uniref:SAP domain-containing protein n=1 Tax=Mycetomoellerius zeteki TaxID=64791 RepID=A0A151WSG1_9HYME|nr:hypothetical protein ALC60_10096 [Trachymyrmex zeteki]
MADENFTFAQLKATLKQLNLPIAGDKATLKKRLYSHDPSGAWRERARNMCVEDRQQTGGQAYTTRENSRLDPIEREMVSNLARDLERTRRENEIMQRRLEELRRERDMAAGRISVPSAANHAPSSMPRPTISALGELLSEFTGTEGIFENWRKQLELIRATYSLDDNNTRILIGMKLKRRALQWFHSKSKHLEMPVRELLNEMKKMFDHRPSKMELRRRFEKRNWRHDESFADYYYDKVILAGKVPVDEDDLR